MPETTPAVGAEFEKNKQKIREFCSRATHTGGVLLVTGTRGVGKTRLVDESLNDRSKIEHGRHEVHRKPRGLKRFIIKVDVDPNFPNPKIEAAGTDANGPDENTLAFILIRNIVFALTSTIDSRWCMRRHGKTLYARLGFWNYWFAANGLIPGMLAGWSGVILLAVFMSLCCLFHHGLLLKWINFVTLATLGAHDLPMSLGWAALLSLSIMLLAWFFLRWQDWRALTHISAELYDLVHAQEKNHNRKHEHENKSEMSSKLPWPLLVLVLACVLAYPGMLATINQSLNPEQDVPVQQAPSAKPERDKPAQQVATKQDPPATPPTSNEPPSGLSALILAAGVLLTFLATYRRSDNTEDLAHFGMGNPVWMITLLRRYLFICHRCGIEPVLVMDELDKLEEIEYWIKHQNQSGENVAAKSQASHSRKMVNRRSDQPDRLSKLGMFMMAIARLKSSLGAEFLWVLISGSKLYAYLQADRHDCKNGALGLLATVIQQDIAIGPTAYESAKQHFSQLNEEEIKVLWLRSRGNFATMVRLKESGEKLISTPFNEDFEKNLADAVINIWSFGEQEKWLGFASETLPIKEKLKSEWVQIWIHAGMLEIANQFLKPSMRYGYFQDNLSKTMLEKFSNIDITPEKTALFSEQPDILSLLGEQALFAYLNAKGCLEAVDEGAVIKFVPKFINEAYDFKLTT